MEKMTWPQLHNYIDEYNKKNGNTYNDVKKKLSAAIVFSNKSWDKEYSEKDRTYRISNTDKYWYGECAGRSLYGSCPAESGGAIRVDWYMPAWIVEYCYLIKED